MCDRRDSRLSNHVAAPTNYLERFCAVRVRERSLCLSMEHVRVSIVVARVRLETGIQLRVFLRNFRRLTRTAVSSDGCVCRTATRRVTVPPRLIICNVLSYSELSRKLQCGPRIAPPAGVSRFVDRCPDVP